MEGLIAATAPPEHIAPLVDLEKMRHDGFLVLPVRRAALQRPPGSVRAPALPNALPAHGAILPRPPATTSC